MSLFNSVLGSLSPKFRSSFEDPRGHEHELPLYRSRSSSPHVPAPIASTVLWKAPSTSLSPPPRIPDDLLAIQRKARHLEHQLQELLDAQAQGLMNGNLETDSLADDITSNGSLTPTVSSVWGSDRVNDGDDKGGPKKRTVGLNAARRGIYRRIQQLAGVKAEEMDILDEDLREVQVIVHKTQRWSQKRDRLLKRIQDIEGQDSGAKTRTLQDEARKLEQEIRQKEEELWSLKARQRKVLNDLAETQNSVEANLASYKTSLSILEKEVIHFLKEPLRINHIPLSRSPFLSLPTTRRTLEMAHDFWKDEQAHMTEKCQEVDIERAALDDGAVLWNNVVKRIVDLEATLQSQMQHLSTNDTSGISQLRTSMENTLKYLDEQMELATSRGWNLLVCAIGAELEALTQGKTMLDQVLGTGAKGKEKVSKSLIETENSATESEDEGSRSAIRITRSPPKTSVPPTQPKFFDTDDEDPDPDLMISHQDTDTD